MPVSDIIDTYKKNRISLHDTNENIVLHNGYESDQYMWVPAGLQEHLVSLLDWCCNASSRTKFLN